MSNSYNVLCLTIDRLQARQLGCYGNTWVSTPHIDRLACESFLFDQAFTDEPTLAGAFRGYWLGQSVFEPPGKKQSLAALFSQREYHTSLLTDSKAVTELEGAQDFHQQVVLGIREPALCGDVEETQLAHMFATLCEHLQQTPSPWMTWAHCQGMAGVWDAPLELRNRHLDEEDPPASEILTAPDLKLSGSKDPDAVLSLTHAYAGQVAVLDDCIGALLEHLEASGLANNTILLLTSPRGMPLGEHGCVGSEQRLYGESVHVPCLMRFPNGLGKLARSSAQILPADLFATMQECCRLETPSPTVVGKSLLPVIRNVGEMPRNHVCFRLGDKDRAIRTPAWFYRCDIASLQTDSNQGELFKKPDDRFEVNNVLLRAGDVSANLEDVMQASIAAIERGEADLSDPLPDPLMLGIE